MCFSALASFSVAVGTGLVGALTATKLSNWRDVPLASIPLLFTLQQTIEGVLWVILPAASDTALSGLLANVFAFIALVVWPLLSPFAVGLVEPNRTRRLIMVLLFVLALPIALLGLFDLSARPYGVCIAQHSLSYSNGTAYSPFELGTYIVCVCCPLLLASDKILRGFGMIAVTGLAISSFFYFVTSFSVWCFFAAAASVTVYLYFTAASEHPVHTRSV